MNILKNSGFWAIVGGTVFVAASLGLWYHTIITTPVRIAWCSGELAYRFFDETYPNDERHINPGDPRWDEAFCEYNSSYGPRWATVELPYTMDECLAEHARELMAQEGCH